MLVLSIRIVLDCFYLLIFYSEKFSTDVRRLPYAVNVNLNLSTAACSTAKLAVLDGSSTTWFQTSRNCRAKVEFNSIN